MTEGKRSDWIEFITNGSAARETPGINPLTAGPENQYHLKIPHGVGEDGPIGIALKGNVSDNLITPNVRVECWYKPIFSSGSAKHELFIFARIDTEFPAPTSTPFPWVRIEHLKSSGNVTLSWGTVNGPITPDGSLVTVISLSGVIGVKFWLKDIDATYTQFYVQYYNGSTWVTVANYLITGIIGQSGYYSLFSTGYADYTADDEDWLDDFVLDEDDVVPESPP